MIQQFNLTNGNDSLFGNYKPNTFIATKGNNNIVGGNGYDTVDYSNWNQAITIKPRGIMDKGDSSEDRISDIEEIIGARGQNNTIDAGGSGNASISVYLGSNRLIVQNIPNIGSLNFTVKNFASVIGTNNADTIIGDGKDNTLKGGAGDDTINGGAGNDIIYGDAGTDMIIGGAGDDTIYSSAGKDLIVGGAGNDTFVLASSNGDRDGESVIIQDFNVNQDKIQLEDGLDYKIVRQGGSSILYEDNGNGTLGDSIAEFSGALLADDVLDNNQVFEYV